MRATLAVLLLCSFTARAGELPADAPTVEPRPTLPGCLTDESYRDHEIARQVGPGSGYVVLPAWGIVAIVFGSSAAIATIAVLITLSVKRVP